MNPSFTLQRKKEQIKVKLSEILRREIDNPAISGVVLTEIIVDKKIQKLVASFSCLGSDPDMVEEELNKAAGFIHKKLFKALEIRSVPMLRFRHDKGFEHSTRIDEILSRLKNP